MKNARSFDGMEDVTLLGNGTLEDKWYLGSAIGEVEYSRAFTLDDKLALNEAYDNNEWRTRRTRRGNVNTP